ncbi:DUF1642 domain-containing protein [Streptococcus sp. SPS1]|uniref:DUF1642 domain-containing protein n=1 Tax=Streptococcus sp. SPS1 TaxID=3018247 RepID=UPI00263CE1A3|nr:DUF1642 domain-containing protein [Streptococcus sp. SPS1]MDN5026563.1 DUF1642 domain-containing protein [Streptococcus sp. SPS1]
MNKQELIDYCNVLKESKGRFINCIDVDRIINTIKQLDEPKQVKVKPFVADWYEENKDDFETSLFQCIYELFKKRNDSELNEFENWVIDENTKPFKTLVNMHQFGYEVEKEKRYLVKMKGMSEENTYLTFRFGHTWMLSNFEECKEFRLHHTRKQLEEAGLGWVFDCPGIEIEEVE